MKNFIYLVVFLLFCSFAKATNNPSKFRDEYVATHFYNCSTIYRQAVDTLISWEENNLKVSWNYNMIRDQLDSCMFFNKDSTKVFSCMLHQGSFRYSAAGTVIPFKGVRFGDRWYFYLGSDSYIVSHLGYIHTLDSLFLPLPFKTLSEFAFENVSGGAIQWNWDTAQPLRDSLGNFIPNEEFFEKQVYRDTEAHSNEWVKSYYNAKIPPAELAKLQQDIAKSKRPLKIDPRTLRAYKRQQLAQYPWYRRWFDRRLRKKLNDEIAPHIPTEDELWEFYNWSKPLP